MAIERKFKYLQLIKGKDGKLSISEKYNFKFQVYDVDTDRAFDYADPCYPR